MKIKSSTLVEESKQGYTCKHTAPTAHYNLLREIEVFKRPLLYGSQQRAISHVK